MSTSVTETTRNLQTAEPTRDGSATVQRRPRSSSPARSLLAQGEPLIWLTGGALMLSVVMILGLLGLVLTLGLETFRPGHLLRVELHDGQVLMGELSKQERFTMTADAFMNEPPEVQQRLLDDWLAAVELQPGLVNELDQKVSRLTRELEQTTSRHDKLRDKVQRLDTRRVQADDPFSRAEMVRHDDQARRSQLARTKLAALQQRMAGLQSEIQAARLAADQFRELPTIDGETLMQTDPVARAAGIDALIRLVASTDDDAVQFRRRMLRTGNYELTNEHFNWVADYQIRPDGETRPTQATLVERMAWGRFYGLPNALTIRRHRTIANGERELATLIEFWQRNVSRLADRDDADVAATLASLQQEHRNLRAQATETFVAELNGQLHEGQRLVLVTAAGDEKSAAELAPDDVVEQGWIVADDPEAAWATFEELHPNVVHRRRRIGRLEKHELGAQYARQEAARLRVRQAELDSGVELTDTASELLGAETRRRTIDDARDDAAAVATIAERRFGIDSQVTQFLNQMVSDVQAELANERISVVELVDRWQADVRQLPAGPQAAVLEYVETEQVAAESAAVIQAEIEHFREQNSRYELAMLTADGQAKSLELGDVVRAFQPNRLGQAARWRVYLSRWWEFLTQDPREANSEGGVLPAIWGTIIMTLIMSVAVVPFGVIAALYLREYAKSGPIVSVIRIAINNLAGVPSIVFGVFGLGFFCYIVGAYVDGGPQNAGFQPLPPAGWFMLLGALAMIALAAFLGGLIGFSGRPASRSKRQRWLAYFSTLAWIVATALFVFVLIKTPFFNGQHQASLPNPTWGKGGVLWASLTLALMTLPVVIVATEEALSAVPNSMREGSYGCGASKWQTIRRIILPHAMPGIMTGMILAMARGAGEVAPLMLVGAVKLAPELPIDGSFPFLHGNRSFMHLGFHIFDVGFQSQNSEAAKPMVYTTTLLLIVIITTLNLVAVWLRSYLKKRFASGQF